MQHPKKKWPPIREIKNRSGTCSYQVDLGLYQNTRRRHNFPNLAEAQTYANQCRIERANEGVNALALTRSQKADASAAITILGSSGVSFVEVAKFYKSYCLDFKDSPNVKSIFEKLLTSAKTNGRRARTIGDLRHRLGNFCDAFGTQSLNLISLETLKNWVDTQSKDYSGLTKRNLITKISQFYNFAVKNGWASENVAKKIDLPSIDSSPVEIYTVDEAKNLLTHAQNFNLLPFIAIGLFAGIRTAELYRLKKLKLILKPMLS